MFYRHRCTQSINITDMAHSGVTCSRNDHIIPPPRVKLATFRETNRSVGSGGGVSDTFYRGVKER